jgi:ubiquinone/menaquinone biosynthesis C-methylase UbiE
VTTSFTHDSAHLAQTYDRLSDPQFESGQRLVQRMGIGPGAHVLDVGCGTGRLARHIAERVGPTGSVVGIDPLADRVALARQQGPGLRFEVGQAEDLSAFPEASFDAVCMSAVFHWVENKPKALAEIRRVLKAGGRLGLTTIPRELMGVASVATALQSILVDAKYASKVDLSKLALASRGLTTTDHLNLMVEAKLHVVEAHVVERLRRHASGADVVDFMQSSSFGNFLRIVPEELQPTLRADIVAAFEARKTPDGIVMTDWGLVVVARRG